MVVKQKISHDDLLTKIGIGHDIHRTEKGTSFLLGGVLISSDFALEGHSDADVLTHAVIDAILGALGKGDIGEWFSDQDEKNRNRSSIEMLTEVMDFFYSQYCEILNLDTIVIAQKPKLFSYKKMIGKSLATVLKISSEQVNVKAKTYEKLGPLGRSEAVEAHAVVLIKRRVFNE